MYGNVFQELGWDGTPTAGCPLDDLDRILGADESHPRLVAIAGEADLAIGAVAASRLLMAQYGQVDLLARGFGETEGHIDELLAVSTIPLRAFDDDLAGILTTVQDG